MTVGWPLACAGVSLLREGFATFGGSTFIPKNRTGTRNHLTEKCDNNVTAIHSPSGRKFANNRPPQRIGGNLLIPGQSKPHIQLNEIKD